MTKRKKKKVKYLQWFPLFWAIITVVSYLGPLLNPKVTGFAIAILLLYPLVLGLNFTGFLFFLQRGKFWYALFPLLLIIAGWPIHSKMVPLGASSSVPLKTDFKLVTFNANYGYSLGGEIDSNEDLVHLLSEGRKPDIWCVQEHTANLDHWISSRVNYKNLIKKENYRTAIYTDFEVIEWGATLFGNYENSCVWADVVLPGAGTIRVYNLHLQSNRVTDQSKKLAKDGLDWNSPTFQSFKIILKNYSKASAMRVDQVDELLQHLESSPHPVIITGDINDVPISYTYRKLSRGRTDSFLKAGKGLGTTYVGAIPLLRIDCVFLDPSLRTVKHEVIPGEFSDHKPVVVWFRK